MMTMRKKEIIMTHSLNHKTHSKMIKTIRRMIAKTYSTNLPNLSIIKSIIKGLLSKCRTSFNFRNSLGFR